MLQSDFLPNITNGIKAPVGAQPFCCSRGFFLCETRRPLMVFEALISLAALI